MSTPNTSLTIDANLEANDANHDVNANDMKKKITDLIRVNPKTSQIEIAKQLGVSRATIQRTMKIMIEEKRIKRIGSTRGYWKIEE